MKIKLTFLSVAFFLFTLAASAQKYGADSVKCVQNLSMYREYIKQKNYKDALPGWRWIFANCPQSTEYMYVDGPTLVKFMLQNEKNPARKEGLVDTLMLIYDQRTQYFGKEGFNLGRKADDLLQYRPNKTEEAYAMFKKSYELQQDKMEARAAQFYFQTALKLNKEEKISKEEALEVYEKVSGVMDANLAKKPNDPYYTPARDNTEALLVESGLATCDAVVGLYNNKFKANPADVELLKKITKMLSKADCAGEQLFLDASTALHKLEPSAESAANIAKMNLKKDNYSEACRFYGQAIDLEQDNANKSQYHYEMAIANHKMGQFANARANAQRAAALRPGWGKPYLLIGDLYASTKDCGEDEFAHKTVYWAAVDKYQQAKAADASVASEANAKIATYSKYFPTKDEGFFRSINEGDTYQVGCWIGEPTKARY